MRAKRSNSDVIKNQSQSTQHRHTQCKTTTRKLHRNPHLIINSMEKFAMKRKMEELLKRHSGPGSAKYSLPGTIGTTTRDPRLTRSPAFSFGQRYEIQCGDCSPGPKYLIKPNSTRCGIETTPKFSLYSRPVELKRPLVPDPGKVICRLFSRAVLLERFLSMSSAKGLCSKRPTKGFARNVESVPFRW